MTQKAMKFWSLMVMAVVVGSLQACAMVAVTAGAAGAGAAIAMDRRTTGAMLEDQAMEMKATDAIYGDKEVGKIVHVTVTSFNNIVLLTGEVPTTEARRRVVEIVRNMSNSSVRIIHNEIRVEPTLGLGARSYDSWLTSETKSRLLYNVGMPTRAKVITSGGNVYLMGLVTQDEGKRLAKISAETRDVKSVVTVFEYLEGDSKTLNATRGKAMVVEHGGATALTDNASVNATPSPANPPDGAVTIPLPPSQ